MIELSRIQAARRLRSQRIESFIQKHANRLVLIRSGQWGAYWREKANGYTSEVKSAGVYTFQEALNVSGHCGPEKDIWYKFLPVSQKPKADYARCMLSDSQLISKIEELTDWMYQNLEVPPRRIPANPNKDYDLLLSDLIWRFKFYAGILDKK